MNTQKFRVFNTRNDFKQFRWAVRQPGCPNRSLALCLHQGHLWCGNYWNLSVASTAAHRHAAYLATMANNIRSTK